MPPFITADHDIVYVEYNIKAKHLQQAPWKIYIYKQVDMDGLRDHLERYKDEFLSSDHCHMSVNDMWVSFKSEVIPAIERAIPTKITQIRQYFLSQQQKITVYRGHSIISDTD